MNIGSCHSDVADPDEQKKPFCERFIDFKDGLGSSLNSQTK